MDVVGRVEAIHRYPVKSMQGETLAGAEVGPQGIPFDRGWALRDEATGKVLAGKREGRLMLAAAWMDGDTAVVALPGGREVAASDPSASRMISDWLDRKVSLERAGPKTEGFYEFQLDGDQRAEVLDIPVLDGTFFDLAPVQLLTTSSLASAAALAPKLDWDVRRFRPTVLIRTEKAGFPEDAWVEGVVGIGDLRCEVLMPTIRCAMPMRPQPGLDAAPNLMPALKAGHNSLLGVYATVSSPGHINVGDPVTLTRA